MAQSRLSLSRYENQAIKYYKQSDELFANKNEVFEAQNSVPSLLSDFKKLFKLTQVPENMLHDVMIEFEDDPHMTRIYAQRQLLMARSAYFDRLFQQYASFNGRSGFTFQGECDVKDDNGDGVPELRFRKEFCSDSRQFREVVAYMYWAFIDLNAKDTKYKFDIFKLASKLELKDLRNNVGKVLADELTKENIAEVLLFSQDYEAQQLKKKCIEYIIRFRDNPSMLDQKTLKERIFKMVDPEKSKRLLREMYENKVQQN